jgi:tetratricopeptide (TPR) repeat protein
MCQKQLPTLTPAQRVKYLKQAITYEPHNIQLNHLLTLHYLEKQNLAKAVYYEQHAMNSSPFDSNLRMSLGQIYQLLHRWDEAHEQFLIAQSLNPTQIAQKAIEQLELEQRDYQSHIYVSLGKFLNIYRPIQQVCDGVFIGSHAAARDLAQLKEYRITHIINASDEIPCYHLNCGIIYHHEHLTDVKESDLIMSGCLQRCIDFITGAISQNGRVLVHCNAGVSRSGAIVVGYLMSTQHLSYEQALAQARKAREWIKPNIGFETQLRVGGTASP